jgi:hypothetical protein
MFVGGNSVVSGNLDAVFDKDRGVESLIARKITVDVLQSIALSLALIELVLILAAVFGSGVKEWLRSVSHRSMRLCRPMCGKPPTFR